MAQDDKWLHVTLLFDPEAFKHEAEKEGDSTDKLTEERMHEIGQTINDEVAGWYGYSGWRTGKIIPDKPTKEDIVHAMDILKAAGMKIETLMDHGVGMQSIFFRVTVPLNRMEDM